VFRNARLATGQPDEDKVYVVDYMIKGAVEDTLNKRYAQGYDLVQTIPRPETVMKGIGDTYIYKRRDAE
jgi:hypothetical protein